MKDPSHIASDDEESSDEKAEDTSESEEEEEALPVGDVIGNTAYSERFVLKTLITLTGENQITEEFVESDLCTLWDMTLEKDIADFLFKHDSLDIFDIVLTKYLDNNRLLETIIGMVANMCCFADIITDVLNKPHIITNILCSIKSDDSLILVQTLRFVYSNVFNDHEHFDEWLNHLKNNEFVPSLNFIMENSANESVLLNAFETLNCICSARLETEKEQVFTDMFINKDVIKATFVAFSELTEYCRKSKDMDIDRCNMLFLSIHYTLSDDDLHSTVLYVEYADALFKHINEIIQHNYNIENEAITDVAEYTVAILTSLNYPASDEAFNIFNNMLRMWQDAYDNLERHHSQTEFQKRDNILKITSTLVQYFVRIIQFWPKDKVRTLFTNIDNKYVKRLNEKIENMLEIGVICDYYNVRVLLENIEETTS